MFCFALLIRWAIVVSGTRNAFAISAVVRPPTALSVSAVAEAGVSAGWQHMKSTISVSSRPVTASSAVAGDSRIAAASSLRLRACSLRS